MECGDYPQSVETFLSLNGFRNKMSKMMSLTDFTCDIAKELLSYADRLDHPEVSSPPTAENDDGTDNNNNSERDATSTAPSIPLKNRMHLFNTDGGRAIR